MIPAGKTNVIPMRIMVLSESKAMDGFGAEHGLSFLIETDHKKVLLDTGASDLFLRNAQTMGINTEGVDNIVLSHGHFDHGDGLQFMDGLPLLCHPGCFVSRFRKRGNRNIGMALSRDEIEDRFDLTVSREPVQIYNNLVFLGEVPRLNDFEAKSTKYVLESGDDDFMVDDSGLVYISQKGLVIISGCAHSGICNMTEHARRITGVDRVEAVIGGFHLSAVNEQTRKTITYLKDMGVEKVCPSHCTMDPALSFFYDEFGTKEVLAGAILEF